MNALSPQPFVIREECHKAAWQHGFRLSKGENGGWAEFQSTTAHGSLWLAASSDSGPWLLALNHPGVIRELALPAVELAGPGIARFSLPSLSSLYAILPRLYQLATSLPDAPLEAFRQQTADLPRGTEVERLVVQRVGQDIFRASLMEYWQGRCPLTGIEDPALLRASHIIPWSECIDDAQRLDVHNGLLLSALWDAAFDRALVTFHDSGEPEFSPTLSPAAREALVWQTPLTLTDQHRVFLLSHRKRLVPSTSAGGNPEATTV